MRSPVSEAPVSEVTVTESPVADASAGWTALVLQPPFVLSIAVLLLNDHVLKAQVGGPVTGKLSDFAGLFAVPFVVAAVVEAAGRGRLRCSSRAFALIAVITGVVFAAVKLDSHARSLAANVGSVARWPLDLLAGRSDPSPIVITPDATDVVAVVALVAAVLVAQRLRPQRSVQLAGAAA